MPPRRRPNTRGNDRRRPYDGPVNEGRSRSTQTASNQTRATFQATTQTIQGGGDRERSGAGSLLERVHLASDESGSGNGRGESIFRSLFPLNGSPAACAGSRGNESLDSIPFDVAAAFRCADDSLTLHVPRELIHKIWSGDYVNLSLLLKKHVEEPASSTFFVNERGEMELRKKNVKSLDNIRDWTDAFLIFSAVLIKKFPGIANELLHYMSLIRDAEARSQGSLAWVAYDENFRMRQSVQPQSWAKINTDLWLRSMTLQASSPPPVPVPSKPNHQAIRPGKPCFDFNSRGCTFHRCKYDHVCTACRGPHKQHDCPRLNFGQNVRSPIKPNRAFQFQARPYRKNM